MTTMMYDLIARGLVIAKIHIDNVAKYDLCAKYHVTKHRTVSIYSITLSI